MAEGNGNGYSRWQLWISMAAVGMVVFGAIITLTWTANSANEKANALESRMDRMTEIVNADRVTLANLQSNQVEIDTQLRASIDDTNKSLAWQLRIDAMLWEQGFKGKSTLPISNAFYPNIANGNSR